MGRRDKQYRKDLKQQVYDKLTSMQAFGESKKEAIKNGTDREKIFSFNTYKTYHKHCRYFINWIQENHPEVTTLKAARKFVNDFLQSRVDQVDERGEHLSAWTIQTEAKALGKLYGITPEDKDFFEAPKRKRSEIKRSRGDRARDDHFSVTNNDELIKFCEGTGLRRRELEELRGKDLISRIEIEDEIFELEALEDYQLSPAQLKHLNALRDAVELFDSEYYIRVRNGKGGRERISPIIGKNAESIVERIKSTPVEDKVWQYVNSNADIHGYRAVYATEIYRAYARPIEEIPFDRINKGTGKKFQSDVYVCRKDEAGKKLDKQAMLKCSKALGHNRLNVVADNYIRGL